jgi:hypothetical protein
LVRPPTVSAARILAEPPKSAETAQHQYGVTFPIAVRAVMKGLNRHPFYKWAAKAQPKDVPRWNFDKYLIGRDGFIAEAFPENDRTVRRTCQNCYCAGVDLLLLTTLRAVDLTGSADKAAYGDNSRCRGGAAPTRLL